MEIGTDASNLQIDDGWELSFFASTLKSSRLIFTINYILISEEVILAEERTTQEERNHIMEARKRAANKRRKLKSMGKSKSTETDEDDEDADEGNRGKTNL